MGWQKKSIFFWIYPFYLIKSVIIAGAITQGAGLRLKRFMPPTLVSAFIKKMPIQELFQIFCANKNFNVPYWMGGPYNLSYLGFSIHLFQNQKISYESRVKQHITHAEKHRSASPHTCKQPL